MQLVGGAWGATRQRWDDPYAWDVLAATNVTPAGVAVYRFLAAMALRVGVREVSSAELAGAVGVRESSIDRLVDRLVEADLVRRATSGVSPVGRAGPGESLVGLEVNERVRRLPTERVLGLAGFVQRLHHARPRVGRERRLPLGVGVGRGQMLWSDPYVVEVLPAVVGPAGVAVFRWMADAAESGAEQISRTELAGAALVSEASLERLLQRLSQRRLVEVEPDGSVKVVLRVAPVHPSTIGALPPLVRALDAQYRRRHPVSVRADQTSRSRPPSATRGLRL